MKQAFYGLQKVMFTVADTTYCWLILHILVPTLLFIFIHHNGSRVQYKKCTRRQTVTAVIVSTRRSNRLRARKL